MHEKIIPTADLISYFRIFSDTPFVAEIAKMTDAEKIAREILENDFDRSYFLAVMSEARYKRIDLYAKKFKNILEVAVGRSPRGLIFTKDPQVNYVATDLPESLEQHKQIIEALKSKHNLKRPNLFFSPANALDFESLQTAVNLLPNQEPLVIISEGFMIYLTREEKKIFLSNVKRILTKRGGALITSDIMFFVKNAVTSSGALELIAKNTGRDMRELNFKDEADANEFFKQAGFQMETVLDEVNLVSMKKLHLENDSAAQRLASRPIWIFELLN